MVTVEEAAPCYAFAVPAQSQPRNATGTLLSAFDDQDKVFSRAFSILQQAITERAFPAASMAVTRNGQLIALKSFGSFVYDTRPQGAPLLAEVVRSGNSDSPSSATIFDLASLTKPIATTTMAAILYERGQLELDAPVIGILPEFRSPSDLRRDEVTFHMLLSHSSGLPAYEKLFLKARSRDDTAAGRSCHSADPQIPAPAPNTAISDSFSWASPSSACRRTTRRFLPARDLRPLSHVEHDVQPA